jgi:hypothetical protein
VRKKHRNRIEKKQRTYLFRYRSGKTRAQHQSSLESEHKMYRSILSYSPLFAKDCSALFRELYEREDHSIYPETKMTTNAHQKSAPDRDKKEIRSISNRENPKKNVQPTPRSQKQIPPLRIIIEPKWHKEAIGKFALKKKVFSLGYSGSF